MLPPVITQALPHSQQPASQALTPQAPGFSCHCSGPVCQSDSVLRVLRIQDPESRIQSTCWHRDAHTSGGRPSRIRNGWIWMCAVRRLVGCRGVIGRGRDACTPAGKARMASTSSQRNPAAGVTELESKNLDPPPAPPALLELRERPDGAFWRALSTRIGSSPSSLTRPTVSGTIAIAIAIEVWEVSRTGCS
ncbi:hypothetical protein GY45DRAFT_744839 [Cubamyces sp. BRFM 1775]|nr:hypothetical protein GY45DRAFT_744839 [Cubamyces sp. BRFM 1775]